MTDSTRRDCVTFWEVAWLFERLRILLERLRDFLRGCMTFGEVSWLLKRLHDLCRGCVTFWEVAWLLERLRDFWRGCVTFGEVAWPLERLRDFLRGCVTFGEFAWLLERLRDFTNLEQNSQRLVSNRVAEWQGKGMIRLGSDNKKHNLIVEMLLLSLIKFYNQIKISNVGQNCQITQKKRKIWSK